MTTEKTMKNIIEQIDNRIKSGEYNLFPICRNRLIKIRGKILHKLPLTYSEEYLLSKENFI